ncbi:MAG TPA: hypothetical protein VFT22_01395 [Kofleriaceae bacterium]|nr:hypothetical protein [Kofleriaceae bacterium]
MGRVQGAWNGKIIPLDGHCYMQRRFARMGGVAGTQKLYRHFVFPNGTHRGLRSNRCGWKRRSP